MKRPTRPPLADPGLFRSPEDMACIRMLEGRVERHAAALHKLAPKLREAQARCAELEAENERLRAQLSIVRSGSLPDAPGRVL
jgi:chromosome segregation ATPase